MVLAVADSRPECAELGVDSGHGQRRDLFQMQCCLDRSNEMKTAMNYMTVRMANLILNGFSGSLANPRTTSVDVHLLSETDHKSRNPALALYLHREPGTGHHSSGALDTELLSCTTSPYVLQISVFFYAPPLFRTMMSALRVSRK